MLEWIHPSELRNHPTNISIYGDTPDPELVASVKAHGVFEDHPIGYVFDGEFRVIVSGHRRNQAAKISKLEMVPCVHLEDIEGDPLAIEERIILSNKQRVKTNEQLAREASRLADIEAKRAEQRKLKSLNNAVDSSSVSDDTNGKTRQKVAESLGTSEATAQRLISAGKALEDAESKGHDKKAERIKKGLEKSAAAGAKAAKPPEPKSRDKNHFKAASNLLAKVEADFKRAAENLAPLVREWDSLKRADSSFEKKHKLLLGHHSRLFQICEDGKRVLKALNEAWK